MAVCPLCFNNKRYLRHIVLKCLKIYVQICNFERLKKARTHNWKLSYRWHIIKKSYLLLIQLQAIQASLRNQTSAYGKYFHFIIFQNPAVAAPIQVVNCVLCLAALPLFCLYLKFVVLLRIELLSYSILFIANKLLNSGF